jgi:hypothetical protein
VRHKPIALDEGEILVSGAQRRNKVVLPAADAALGGVAAVAVRWDELHSHRTLLE